MLDVIRAHLRDSVQALIGVDGAAAFQVAAEANPKATPFAFVLLLGERAGQNLTDSFGVHQRIQAKVGIVYVTRNVGDTTGAGAAGSMDDLRAAGNAALLGWSPGQDYEPLERAESTLLAFRDGHMWWQDTYLTAYYQRSY